MNPNREREMKERRIKERIRTAGVKNKEKKTRDKGCIKLK